MYSSFRRNFHYSHRYKSARSKAFPFFGFRKLKVFANEIIKGRAAGLQRQLYPGWDDVFTLHRPFLTQVSGETTSVLPSLSPTPFSFSSSLPSQVLTLFLSPSAPSSSPMLSRSSSRALYMKRSRGEEGQACDPLPICHAPSSLLWPTREQCVGRGRGE